MKVVELVIGVHARYVEYAVRHTDDCMRENRVTTMYERNKVEKKSRLIRSTNRTSESFRRLSLVKV